MLHAYNFICNIHAARTHHRPIDCDEGKHGGAARAHRNHLRVDVQLHAYVCVCMCVYINE